MTIIRTTSWIFTSFTFWLPTWLNTPLRIPLSVTPSNLSPKRIIMTSSQLVSTPRVNKALLPNYLGRTVRLVGKVDGIDSASGICVLNTSDRASVNVVVNPMSHYDSQFVEVLGKVNNDLSISDMSVTNLGTNFDLDIYEQFLQITHQFHKELWGY